MFFSSLLMFIVSFLSFSASLYLLFNSTFIIADISIFSILSMNFPISLILDWPSMMFLSTVIVISAAILLFSMDYIPKSEHNKFFLILLSFVLSMMLLIMSNNIIFMILGWDGLGFSSFILVIYYQNFSASASGAITIFSNRVGDIFILLSIASLLFSSNWDFMFNENYPYMILLLLTFAAFSKSAQFPFSAWLPAAMAAPTPISALVHSSTLVTAGVYLLIRIMNNPHPNSMFVILVISSITTLYASMSANWEMDMKKIIALSTLSQIAMMMFAIAIGSISLAFFHLIIHAMFKSLMFLCAGIMIHSSSYQDMRKISPLFFSAPIISSILGISSMALMGIPFMSGFFSKDPIIELVTHSKLLSILSSLMILSIGLTSTYSTRMILMTLKFQLKHNPNSIMVPSNFMETSIMILAPLSIFMGASMLWLICPEQIIIIPLLLKISMLFIMMIGMLMGLSFYYFKNSYKNLGQAGISLWFMHFLTAVLSKPLNPLIMFFQKNDKNWQESYGPNMMWSYSSFSSRHPNMLASHLLFLILIMTLYPVIVIILY